MTIVFSMGSCYLLRDVYIFIHIWQAIHKYFIHLIWNLFFSHFIEKLQQLPKFLSLKFRKGQASQKLRAVKENVSVKNTGTRILLQFSGESPKWFWWKIQQQLKGRTVGGKTTKLKALQSLILLLLSLVWGLLPGMFLNAVYLPPVLSIYLVFISYTELPSCCCNLLIAAGFLVKMASKMDLMVCICTQNLFRVGNLNKLLL